MDPLDTYQRLRALQERRAVPTTTRRHVHLASRPFVVAAHHMAGEIGAPLAIMWGSDPDPARSSFLAIAEPRNRQQRFVALDQFGVALGNYLLPFWARRESRRLVRGELKIEQTADDAPQLVVPNSATAAWLSNIVGRFTRYLRVDGDDPVPPSVPRLGQHLTFFGQTSTKPGSCISLAATDGLKMHFATGQLDGETQTLATMLGWIDPPSGLDGAQAARVAEDHPPAGPLPDPNWDAETLEVLIERWHAAPDDRRRREVHGEISRAARAQIAPAWIDTWRALQILHRLPEAAHVSERWADDCRAWATHTDRMDRNQAFFTIHPNALSAARHLRRTESSTQRLEAEMALDDPAMMARAIARGEAIEGVISEIEPEHREVVNGRRRIQPLFTLETDISFPGPIGTRLRLSTNPEVTAELTNAEMSVAHQRLTFRVMSGANQTKTRGRLPALGARAVLSPYGGSTYLPPNLPNEIPWTHMFADSEEVDA